MIHEPYNRSLEGEYHHQSEVCFIPKSYINEVCSSEKLIEGESHNCIICGYTRS